MHKWCCSLVDQPGDEPRLLVETLLLTGQYLEVEFQQLSGLRADLVVAELTATAVGAYALAPKGLASLGSIGLPLVLMEFQFFRPVGVLALVVVGAVADLRVSFAEFSFVLGDALLGISPVHLGDRVGLAHPQHFWFVVCRIQIVLLNIAA